MEKNNTYRLTSLEEPTEEQLFELMKQVGQAARESSRRVAAEKKRRMREVKETLAEYRKKLLNNF